MLESAARVTISLWGAVSAPPWVPWTILTLVAVQRLLELVKARRNTMRLLACGGREVAPDHYPYIVGLHAVWLIALVIWTAIYPGRIIGAWLAVYVMLQAARAWTLMSLGPRFTTRIITLPGAPLVRRGPYRFLRHPNYVVVILEIAVLPLALTAWPLAVVFSILNALVLRVRLRAENAVLAERSA